MPRLPRRPARAALAAPALAVAAVLCLAGCGNNGVAEQSKEHSSVSGASGQAGSVLIRNATLTLGLGGGAVMAVAFFNGAGEADALTAMTSPQAASFTLPTAAGTANAYGDPSDNPQDDVTAAPAAVGGAGVGLPAQTGVFLGGGRDLITVAGLTGSPLIGQSVPVTFTFRSAGSVTLYVPITGGPQAGNGASPLPSVTAANAAGGPTASTPAPSASASPGAGGLSESPTALNGSPAS